MTLTAMVASWLGIGPSSSGGGRDPALQQHHRPFVPTKDLCETDYILVDMLNSAGHEEVCYCVCDPALTDCPIIYASPGFCRFTGYDSDEIEGRNCRFLQGPKTSAADVARIRNAIQDYHDVDDNNSGKAKGTALPDNNTLPVSVNLLNYRKDGQSFCNEFFLSPLRDSEKRMQYLIGVQCPVSHLGPGQAPSNAGWIYTQGSHV